MFRTITSNQADNKKLRTHEKWLTEEDCVGTGNWSIGSHRLHTTKVPFNELSEVRLWWLFWYYDRRGYGLWPLRVQIPRIRKVSVLRLLIVRECCMLSVGKHSDNSNNNVHCESPYVTWCMYLMDSSSALSHGPRCLVGGCPMISCNVYCLH